MNWSLRCCKYRRHNEYTFIFLSTFICLLPVLFYTSARYFGIIKKTTILSRKSLLFVFKYSCNKQICKLTVK